MYLVWAMSMGTLPEISRGTMMRYVRTTNGCSVGINSFLSVTDVTFIRYMYPFEGDLKYILYGGEQLVQGQYIHSQDGRYQLLFQRDGNVVIYKDGIELGKATWNTGTYGNPQTPQQPIAN